MAKNERFKERLAQAFRAAGYWPTGRDKPKIYEFADKFDYMYPSAIYRWVEGEVPRGRMLLKLARDLGTTPEYLLGEEPETPPARQVSGKRPRKPAPISGASGAAAPPDEHDIIWADRVTSNNTGTSTRSQCLLSDPEFGYGHGFAGLPLAA